MAPPSGILDRWSEYVLGSIDEVAPATRRLDLVVLFVVIPGVLLGIEGVILASAGPFAGITRDQFWFELTWESYLAPATLVDLYASSFAHAGWADHLRPNLVFYLLCMSALYPIAVVAGKRADVLKLVAAIVVVAPIVVNATSIAYLGGRSIGFSGILAGCFGLLAVVTVAAVDERTATPINPLWSLVVILLVYDFVLVLFGPVEVTTVLGIIVLGITGWLGRRVGRDGIVEIGRLATRSVLFPWGAVVAVLGVVGLFYGLPAHANLVGHLAGYFVGWAFGYAEWSLG